MTEPSDVFVIAVEGRYLVRPATAIVRPGQEFLSFRNLTEYDAVLEFPPGTVTPMKDRSASEARTPTKARPAEAVVRVSVAPGDRTAVRVPVASAVAFAYRVVLEEIGVDAQGNSGPIMIIDR